MSDFKLIGLTGGMGVGKDTVAKILRDDHGFDSYAFAAPIKQMVARLLNVQVELLEDREFKEKPIKWLNEKTPRYLMQTIGTEWGRDLISSDIWTSRMEQEWLRAQSKQAGAGLVITDVRFDNEAQAISDLGGEVWRVYRETGSRSTHPSENGVCVDFVDRTIFNTGSMWDLKSLVMYNVDCLYAAK